MSGVTDCSYRQIIAECGKPDVMFTEFVSCAGLCSGGRERLLPCLKYDERERPIVAQIFGSRPDDFYNAAKQVVELGFDGIDVNAGCPDKSVEKQGAGASLMKDPDRIGELILAAKRGAGDLPVSVKTRLGYNEITIMDWLPSVLAAKPAVVSIHFRTRKQRYRGEAQWEYANPLAQLIRESGCGALFLGNGDITDLDTARQLGDQYDVDGVMVGRAVMGNPWFFDADRPLADISIRERVEMMLRHSNLYEELHPEVPRCAIMKKHYKAYATGFKGAKELRMKLMEARSFGDVREVLEAWLRGESETRDSR